jgi:hypothetical protein
MHSVETAGIWRAQIRCVVADRYNLRHVACKVAAARLYEPHPFNHLLMCSVATPRTRADSASIDRAAEDDALYGRVACRRSNEGRR